MNVEDYTKQFQSEMDLAKELVGKLPNGRGLANFDDAEAMGRPLDRIDGAALRSLRQLLDQKDPSRQWGNLKRILTPEGDYLWLCEHHAKEFNP